MDNVKANSLCSIWQATSGKIKLCGVKLCGRRRMSSAPVSRIQGISFWKKVTSFTGVVVWLLVVSLLADSIHLMSK